MITNLTIGAATALIGHRFGPSELAGFGTGARLEYLLVRLIFGVGGTLVAMVGMNVGARRGARARRAALFGTVICLVLTEGVGLTAALAPAAWLRLFGIDPAMVATGATYLWIVGPFYGFGFALYLANQGAGTLMWPVLGGLARLVLVAVGGWIALTVTGLVVWLYVAIAAGLLLYGTILTIWTLHAPWGTLRASERDVPQT